MLWSQIRSTNELKLQQKAKVKRNRRKEKKWIKLIKYVQTSLTNVKGYQAKIIKGGKRHAKAVNP